MTAAVRVVCAFLSASLLGTFLASSLVAGEYVVGWEDPALVEDYDLSSSYYPVSAADGEGNVMALWCQSGGGMSIYASLYKAGEGWQDRVEIDDTDSETRNPVVAMNRAGDAFAVWEQWNDTASIWNLWVNRYDGSGWSGASPVEAMDSIQDRYPDIAVDSEGNALLVWTRIVDPSEVMMSRYEVGTGWSAPVSVDGTETGDAVFASIGVDDEDDFVLVWVQYDMSSPSVWARHYDSTGGWEAPVKLADSGMYGGTVLSVGEGGDAICAWSHWNDTSNKYEVWSCVLESGSGWGDSIMSDESYDLPDPEVAIDRDGDALLLWWTSGGIGDGVYCRPYEAGLGWGDVSVVASSYAGEVSEPVVAMNGDGDALCLFDFYDGAFHNVRGAVYASDGEWAPSVQLNEPGIVGVSFYCLTIDDDGGGMAIWDQSDGAKMSLWASRYLPVDETPPSLTIDSPEDGEILESPTVAVVGWSEPGVTVAVNGVLAAVDEDGYFSVDIVLQEGENTIYVTATDPAGNSASASTTVTYELGDTPSPDDLTELIALLNDTLLELDETIDDLAETVDGLDDANRRIDDLSAQVLVLTALLCVFLLLTAVMVVLYLGMRKRVAPPRVEEEPPPPTQ